MSTQAYEDLRAMIATRDAVIVRLEREREAAVRLRGTPPPVSGPFEGAVRHVTNQVAGLLVEKNAKYGNAALEPARIFSKASPVEQILVRIDDKLSRIRTTGLAGADEDTTLDLIGYLVLLRVAQAQKP